MNVLVQNQQKVSAQIGMLLFLAAEAMFFAGLISAFLVLRVSFIPWPPVGQPRLPVVVTAINTGILLLSGFSLWRTRSIDKNWRLAVGTGFLFLVIQGVEWLKLMNYGFTMTHNPYAGLFYVLIGAHALHVLGGLIFLVLSRDFWRQGHPEPSLYYWTFVVLLWPILYVLVYF
jgi:heme/copper-type cytochrome/quinol oxidase subunit 3